MYTISINLPDLPEGTEVEVDGLGVFANGSTNDISDELADMFQAKHSTIQTEIGEDGNHQNSIVPGRTLEEAFEGNTSIVVEGKSKAAATSVKPAKEKSVPTNPEGSEN